MKKDPAVFLQHILESIEAIETYLRGVKKEVFYKSSEKQDSVVRRIEIIGEAAKNIPEVFRRKHSNIPWKKMAGMRDVMIHEYFGVNYIRVWQTTKQLLPPLKIQIEKLLKEYTPK